MFFKIKNHSILLLFFCFIILTNCQLQEPSKNHGIVFLKNRSDKLVLFKSNKNDVIKIIGQPHSKSISSDDEWIYIERVLTRGEFHKLGQNVLKANNVLVIKFDKYGVIKEKKLYDINDKEKIKFSKKITENELTEKSFIEKFLSSVRTKMYGNR